MKIEIKKNMYVRFKKGKVTYVRKLLEVIHNFEEFNVYRTDKEYFDYEEKDYFDIVYPNEIICEPSYNIIDLIEVDDYVNGSKVGYIDDCKGSMRQFNYDYEDKDVDCGHWSEEIKTVLTREQFEREVYKI